MSRIAFVFVFLATPVLAEDRLHNEFNLEEAIEVCTGCHGEDGRPIELDYPIINGQQFFYIYTQLKDFAAGRRSNDIMTDIASKFSRAQMKQISQYISEQPWPAIQAATIEGDSLLAERGVTGGQCSACHGKWEGDSRIPRLAGQQPDYIARTMSDFKHDVRMNAPDKNSTMKQLSDETIAALSRYLSSL
ncbi:MAG: c-type cytochrome [Verrucomicrobia bacterium]|nr:c-type cytochrome [Verrucomicrobiota bacterium]